MKVKLYYFKIECGIRRQVEVVIENNGKLLKSVDFDFEDKSEDYHGGATI